MERNHNLWNTNLKEEFLHDVNAKNAGNKARNDVESIVKEEGYHPLVLSVDNWYQMSTLAAQRHKARAFGQALDQLKQGDELLIQFQCFTIVFLNPFG